MSSKKSDKVFGLYPRSFPKPVQWKVDQDYLAKLSDEERAWLARFNDEFYGGSFSGPPEDSLHPPELRRECYAAKNAVNADSYEIARVSGRLFPAEAAANVSGDKAAVDAPAYLSEPDYKAARDEYREHLPKDRKARVVETPAMKAARERLNRQIRASLLANAGGKQG